MRTPTTVRAVARGLALVLLEGPWNRTELIARAADALGERPPWLSSVVRRVLSHFAVAPHDAHETLSRVIRLVPSFRRSFGPGRRPPRLVKLLAGESSMGVRRWPVPPLPTTVDLARWLEVTVAELDWFADPKGLNVAGSSAFCHYSFRWQPKKRGGYRLLEAPKSRLKGLQRRVLHEILDLVPVHGAAHGFVGGRSPVTCASVHAGRASILRMDLEEFFPSVGSARIYRIFRSFGYPEPVARALTGLCTLKVPSRVTQSMPPPSFVEQYDQPLLAARERARRRLRHRHLAQGAPTSPALANLACYRLDARLRGAASAVGATYTRYADDLAFSGDAAFAARARHFEALVGAIALEEGFRVNHRKTRLMRRSQSQRLLGLVVNDRAHVPRAERDRIEAILTNILRHGLASQNRDRDPDFLASIRGRVAWVAHVNPSHARKLLQLLAACDEKAATPTGE